MKLGVREICDVVLKAKSTIKIGSKVFYKDEPVLYFDTLKTSTLEGAATTVYAQGGRGNARLVAWEGERTVTFTMEDALISPESFMILSGAGLIEASAGKPLKQHVIENTDDFKYDAETKQLSVWVENKPFMPAYDDYNENFAYVMVINTNEGASEPFIPKHEEEAGTLVPDADHNNKYKLVIDYEGHDDYVGGVADGYKAHGIVSEFATNVHHILVDYYVEKTSGAVQINIEADKFGGNYYLEAATLFRDQNGVDLPAEFIIPNCKIQSNFSFSMASSGDPSTFTFTMDAFPDYTRFDKSKKVLAALQLIAPDVSGITSHRTSTFANSAE